MNRFYQTNESSYKSVILPLRPWLRNGVSVKIITFGILLLTATLGHAAQTVYVTDSLEILLRSGQGTEFKIIASVETGTPLTRIRENKTSGWTQVRTLDRQKGWVLTRFLTNTPVASVRLKALSENFDRLKEKNTLLSTELSALKSSLNETVTQKDTLSDERAKLSQDLAKIQHASENSLQILNERDQLQERVVNLERNLQTLKRDKQTLEDSSSQDWFMIGAAVLFSGIALGLILPRISWRRKTSSWESF